MNLRSLITKAYHTIEELFLNGLFFLLPIAITVSLFNFCFSMLKKWFDPLKHFAETHNNIIAQIISKIPHFEIILVILFIFIIGLISKTFLIKPFVHFFEHVLDQIPFIRSIYFGVKKLVSAFSGQDTLSFKEVVILEFPKAGVFSIGFLTNETATEMSPQTNTQFFNVFVPHTPNPTTGFFLMVPQNAIHRTILTRQEAMALIMSGGILQPERFIKTEEKPIC